MDNRKISKENSPAADLYVGVQTKDAKIKAASRKFSISGLIIVVALLIVSTITSTTDAKLGIIYGGLISAVTSVSGFFLLVKTIRLGTTQVFLKIFLGGMVVRIFVALAALALGLGIFDLPVKPLIISCLATYFVFTLLEYIFLFPLLIGREHSEAE